MEDQINSTWQIPLRQVFDKPFFQELIRFIQQEYTEHPNTIFPKKEEVFRAFNLCSFENLKVVILGQDPYPTAGHAHGLCFSCDAHVRPLPKSLQNIFKELEADLGVQAPKHGDLSHWAKQGVLLLNAILTVREGQPLSHANKGWEAFTDHVIEIINKEKEGVVFVLWGAPAQQKGRIIDETNHIVIRAPHPSPLSAYRGFFGSSPFSRVNEALEKQGKMGVAWAQ